MGQRGYSILCKLVSATPENTHGVDGGGRAPHERNDRWKTWVVPDETAQGSVGRDPCECPVL